MKNNKFIKMLNEICKEENIQLDVLSFGMIKKLTKDGKTQYIYGKNFSGNSDVFNKIVSDKYALYEVLHSCKLPIIEHKMFFNPKFRNTYMTEEQLNDELKSYCKKYKNNLVLKPNDGREGKNVYHLTNYADIEEKLNMLFSMTPSVSLCPFYEAEFEYRVIYLDGKCELVFRKERPYVIGNGKNTVKELYDLGKGKFTKYCTIDESDNVDLQYIPKKNEKVNLTWKHNLYRGAIPTIVKNKEKLEQIVSFVNKIAKKINIFFAAIDILELEDNKLILLEINSSVCMTIFEDLVDGGYDICKNIYKKAIVKEFE